MSENEKRGRDLNRKAAGPRPSNDQLGENAGEGRAMQSQGKGKGEKKKS